MVKIHTLFQTKTAQIPYALGPHISIWLIEGSTTPPPKITSDGNIQRTQFRHVYSVCASLNLETHKFYYVTLLNLICDGNKTVKKRGTFSLFTEVLLSPMIVERTNENKNRGRLMTANAMGWGYQSHASFTRALIRLTFGEKIKRLLGRNYDSKKGGSN